MQSLSSLERSLTHVRLLLLSTLHTYTLSQPLEVST